jgi:hypothetical protein
MDAWRRRWVRDRHEQQIRVWKRRQKRAHDWVNFSDIADWCARETGTVRRSEAHREQAWHDLYAAVINNEFELDGRCRVAYLPHGQTRSDKPLRLRLCVDDLWQCCEFVIGRTPPMLPDCWAPRAMCLRWFQARDIRPPPWLDPPGAARKTSEVPAKRSKDVGGRPPKWDWPAFDREMVRLANMPDGLPKRPILMRHMLDWSAQEWGDTPSESTMRKHIGERYPE